VETIVVLVASASTLWDDDVRTAHDVSGTQRSEEGGS